MRTTRDALVDAATALLEEGGVAAVTLREVGRRSGVSHNAPYKHFADKEELLAAVAARELRRSLSTSDEQKSRRPAEVLRARLHALVADALAHPEVYRLTFGPWKTGSAELAEAAEAARAGFLHAVEAAQADGSLPAADPERLTALLWALTHGAIGQALTGHLARDGKGRADPDDLVDDLFDYLGVSGRGKPSRSR